MGHTAAMARVYDRIDEKLAVWIVGQPVFFVATAPLAGDGHVNCSPKGNRGELRVLDPHTVAYVDQTGSGIETVAHLRENGRIVVMLCAFTGPPKIVRLHGTGRVLEAGSDEFAALTAGWPAAAGVGVRSLVVVEVTRVADSCGYGVPFMTFDRHRPTLDEWTTRSGTDGMRKYQAANNATSLDGLEGLPRLAGAAATPSPSRGRKRS